MNETSRYADRADAGRRLASHLSRYAGRSDVLVLALPRGGVPVGAEVARALNAPLDVFVVRKLGAPFQEEYALGAIASGGSYVVSPAALEALGVSRAALAEIVERERAELTRRDRLYRGDRPFPDVAGKTVIVVDDGLATGASMLTALAALRPAHPARIVAAAPVGSCDGCVALRREADEVVCPLTPAAFHSVGSYYRDFTQVDDATVCRLLAASDEAAAAR